MRSLGGSLLACAFVLGGCADGKNPGTGGSGASGSTWSSGGAGGSSTGGAGGDGAASSGTASGGAGTGGNGGAPTSSLEELLVRLRADTQGTLLEESNAEGWPVHVDEGWVVVTTDSSLDSISGGFNDWMLDTLIIDDGFRYAVIESPSDDRGYKFSDGEAYQADPWSRSYAYDEFGELSLNHPGGRRLDRFRSIGDAEIEPRTVTVLHPAEAPTHVLYLHDGQNLFAPDAFFGGWKLLDTAPAGMLLVGIDNSPARMDEYTHVADVLDGSPIGGEGDAYVAYLESAIRPLVASHYGEPAKVGVLGSSLGGLISLHAGYENPATYDFVGSMSGTLGWGSFGPHTGETMIERYEAAGVQPFVIYLDSGGDGPCEDADGDGIFDDGAGSDNYCETVQLRDVLSAQGYVFGENLHHWHEPNAPHNEAAWAARVFRPLEIFAAL